MYKKYIQFRKKAKAFFKKKFWFIQCKQPDQLTVDLLRNCSTNNLERNWKNSVCIGVRFSGFANYQ